jgi:hypothetical protein
VDFALTRSPNGKLTDDEERAKSIGFETAT